MTNGTDVEGSGVDPFLCSRWRCFLLELHEFLCKLLRQTIEYFIAAGSRTASWPVFSQPVIPRCIEVP